MRYSAPFSVFGPLLPARRATYTGRVIHTNGAGTVNLAVRLALRFGGQAPSVPQLRNEFGMSRATAYRWRRAFLDALGKV